MPTEKDVSFRFGGFVRPRRPRLPLDSNLGYEGPAKSGGRAVHNVPNQGGPG
jgi:hypothetical protein